MQAWNDTGHMLAAWIAYVRLSPAAKAKVDAVLRTHPDYPAWVKDVPEGGDRGLEAFLDAATWPDHIKGDARFWEPGGRRNGEPTPLLPGYPDMQVHNGWHYRDEPLEVDGVRGEMPPTPNLLTKMLEFSGSLDNAYRLAWFLHLAGDAHQPLHAVSRFTAADADGDRGGNEFALEGSARNLHAFWDRALGETQERKRLGELASELAKASPGAAVTARTDYAGWLRESFDLARTFVYRAEAPRVSEGYEKRAQEVARQRVVLAGFRIAAVLNNRLQ